MKKSHLTYLAQVGALGLIYFGTAQLGLTLATAEGNVTLVWPPAGIALAALLLFGTRLWPGITLGTLAVTLNTDAPLLYVGAASAGNTVVQLPKNK